MITVKPNFQISQEIGDTVIELQPDGIKNVKDLIKKLASIFKEKGMEGSEKDIIKRIESTIITVNGRDIKFLKGLKTKLKDGDVVHIINPAAGG